MIGRTNAQAEAAQLASGIILGGEPVYFEVYNKDASINFYVYWSGAPSPTITDVNGRLTSHNGMVDTPTLNFSVYYRTTKEIRVNINAEYQKMQNYQGAGFEFELSFSVDGTVYACNGGTNDDIGNTFNFLIPTELA